MMVNDFMLWRAAQSNIIKKTIGTSLPSLLIALVLSSIITLVAVKGYLIIKTIVFHQQDAIELLQKKEVVYSFLFKDINSAGYGAEVQFADRYNQLPPKLLAKLRQQIIKPDAVILLLPNLLMQKTIDTVNFSVQTSQTTAEPYQLVAYYLARDQIAQKMEPIRRGYTRMVYTLYRDNFVQPAIGIADGIVNIDFKLQPQGGILVKVYYTTDNPNDAQQEFYVPSNIG